MVEPRSYGLTANLGVNNLSPSRNIPNGSYIHDTEVRSAILSYLVLTVKSVFLSCTKVAFGFGAIMLVDSSVNSTLRLSTLHKKFKSSSTG